MPTCGNGQLDEAEDCDGELGTLSCQALGLGEGEVACHPSACRLDASACSAAPWTPIDCGGGGGCDEPPPPPCGGLAGCDVAPGCGDSVLDRGEQCDGSELGGASCASLGYSHGTLRCGPDCGLDVSGCGYCGDGVSSGAEACDGGDLAGLGCRSLGFTDGVLGCTPECQLDPSQCFVDPGEFCGDGALDFPEQCDGGDFAGRTCESLDLGQGPLRCTRDCRIDTSACVRQDAFCGDGLVSFPEQCDGRDLAGQSCWSVAGLDGQLGCTPDCGFDVSRCVQPMAFCGDGLASFPEQCDGPDFSGESCQTLTGLPGQLGCDPFCRFDLRGCQDPTPQDCQSCAVQRCPDEANACLSTPGCVQGLTCWLQSCGGFNDPMCVVGCFGGDFGAIQVAFATAQCLAGSCADACNL